MSFSFATLSNSGDSVTRMRRDALRRVRSEAHQFVARVKRKIFPNKYKLSITPCRNKLPASTRKSLKPSGANYRGSKLL